MHWRGPAVAAQKPFVERFLLRFRIAALLYQKNRKYSLAIELSKKDAQLQDCIDTAKESGSAQLVEDLLKYAKFRLHPPRRAKLKR